MISKLCYHDLTKTDTVVTKISQVISAPVYTAVVSVCFLVWHLDYTLVHPLPVRIIKPSLTITAWVLSWCKHPYWLLPSPSWIMVTHSDLGNEFLFRYRDRGDSHQVTSQIPVPDTTQLVTSQVSALTSTLVPVIRKDTPSYLSSEVNTF